MAEEKKTDDSNNYMYTRTILWNEIDIAGWHRNALKGRTIEIFQVPQNQPIWNRYDIHWSMYQLDNTKKVVPVIKHNLSL